MENNKASNKELLIAMNNKENKKYVDRYNIYQQIKNKTKVLVKKLIVNKILKKPWIHLIVNLITKLLLIAVKNLSSL